MRAHPDATHASLSLSFNMHSFDSVAWKTAQTTGAFAYMPYTDARTYSDIYTTQDELFVVEKQLIDEVISTASLVSSTPDNWKPSPTQIDGLTQRIGALQMRLLLLDSFIDSLDKEFQKYKSAHT